MEERIKRINELYHKSKTEGLTQEEILEQAHLRRQYLDNIKANLQAQLKSIRFVEDEIQEEEIKEEIQEEIQEEVQEEIREEIQEEMQEEIQGDKADD